MKNFTEWMDFKDGNIIKSYNEMYYINCCHKTESLYYIYNIYRYIYFIHAGENMLLKYRKISNLHKLDLL